MLVIWPFKALSINFFFGLFLPPTVAFALAGVFGA
jgi:hypothetical protein